MTSYRTQTVSEILEFHSDVIKVLLDDDSHAYAFPKLNGEVNIGDEVVINTTAVDLNLGTGGWHFILWNKSNKQIETPSGGHIMKLRYTPLQIDTGVAEEHESWDDALLTIDPMRVIAAPLHSHIPAIASYIKSKDPSKKIACIISDGASLPIAFSNTVRELKEKELLDTIITYGHAFGGDIESINIYTALLSAKNIAKAEIVIVSMGPGIVGTNTRYGFTGIEVGYHLDVAKSLGGQTYGVIRASSAEPRERHYGISHHSLTTYSKATFKRHTLGIIDDHDLSSLMQEQLSKTDIISRHNIVELGSVGIVSIMKNFGLNVSSMGRDAEQDELFFEMAAISARI